MEKSTVFKLLHDIMHWWGAGLKAWIPPSLLKSHQQERQIHMHIGENLLSLALLQKNGKVETRQQFKHSQAAIPVELSAWLKRYDKLKKVLVLSQGQFLIKDIQLPASIHNNLAEIMHFEVEKQTPFLASQVYFGYEVKSASGEDSQLQISLAVVPKKVAEQIQTLLIDHGISINGFLAGEGSSSVYVDVTSASSNLSDSRRLFTWLMLLSFTLLMIWLYQPVMHYEDATESLRLSLVKKKRLAEQTKLLQKQNMALLSQLTAVNEAVRTYDSRLNILAELTQLLPDNSWLSQCIIENSHIRIRGHTSSVTELTNLLNQSDLFTGVRLNQSGNHSTQQGKQLFDAVLIMSHAGKNNV